MNVVNLTLTLENSVHTYQLAELVDDAKNTLFSDSRHYHGLSKEKPGHFFCAKAGGFSFECTPGKVIWLALNDNDIDWDWANRQADIMRRVAFGENVARWSKS